MSNVINQFMWAYQQHFAIQVHIRMQSALEAIGLAVDPEVILVGFSTTSNVEHPICVEPETGPLSSDDLRRVPSFADELYEVNPESKLFHSHPSVHELRQEALRRHSRADALRQTIQASRAHADMTFFVSPGSPIHGYHVHICVGVPSEPLNALPALADEVVDRIFVGRSLQHQVITETLRRADAALYLPDPGTDMFTLGATGEIVAAAAERFTQGMVYRATGQPADLFRLVNEFTSLGYERSGAAGRLLITKSDSPANSLRVRFERPVQLSEPRSMRKLLQLTDESTAVLVGEGGAFGLGTSESGQNCVEIEVTNHAEWEASIDRQRLVRVAYGRASLPRAHLARSKVEDALERVIGSADFPRIWSIIQAAQDCGHGMTLVITDDPESETQRLSREAVSIEARFLSPADIVRFGQVDGAVLLGPDGRCYAFGVILDGKAEGRGDRARGSRYNSAVRYQRTPDVGAIVLVVSDDGIVNLIPDLMPRIARSEVEEAVDDFIRSCEGEELDHALIAQAYERLKDLRFYLSAEQCDTINILNKRLESQPMEVGSFRIIQPPLQPNPDMEDSYFL